MHAARELLVSGIGYAWLVVKNRTIQLLAGIALLALTACTPSASDKTAPILLFNGSGTTSSGVAALEKILKNANLKYLLVDSAQLNNMSEAQLAAYRLLIIPGGNYLTMGNSLTMTTTTNIHNAVQGGLNYLGVCAGGLLAGDAPCHNLNLAAGVRFDFYTVVNQNIHKAVVEISSASTAPLEQYWEDGPQFTGWGEVVGKYPDGTPAIVQGKSGQGWVVLSGVHAEAPDNWRRGMNFTTSTSVDNAYARTLIEAALNGTALPHY